MGVIPFTLVGPNQVYELPINYIPKELFTDEFDRSVERNENETKTFLVGDNLRRPAKIHLSGQFRFADAAQRDQYLEEIAAVIENTQEVFYAADAIFIVKDGYATYSLSGDMLTVNIDIYFFHENLRYDVITDDMILWGDETIFLGNEVITFARLRKSG